MDKKYRNIANHIQNYEIDRALHDLKGVKTTLQNQHVKKLTGQDVGMVRNSIADADRHIKRLRQMMG